MLTREECTVLYERAECSGEPALFSSSSRDAFAVAKLRCGRCPVIDLCAAHVRPEEGYTGTCAGRLFYEGVDVTKTPSAVPPPLFRGRDVDMDTVAALVAGCPVWEGHTESTVMTACWALRRTRTFNRIAKVSGLDKELVVRLVHSFDDGASSVFKDFITSQSKKEM